MGAGMKSTRGWDDVAMVTVLQREKEDAHDYRYFPDPDLVPVTVSEAWLAEIEATLPELPLARKSRYVADYGLPPRDAEQLVDDRDLCLLFDEAAREAATGGAFGGSGPAGYAAAKIILNNLIKKANELGREPARLGIGGRQVAEILALRERGVLGAQSVDPIVAALVDAPPGTTAATVADRLGLAQVHDETRLDAWVLAAIAAQPQAAADLAAGKEAAIGRLVGHVMKLSGGKVDATVVQRKLRERVGSAGGG
jgi:aspartyl-tRNA(Asn)/glutamyl-tRNA(Gln) amidotransferase subunit B